MTEERTRPSRAETVRRERRMKPGAIMAEGIKLELDETKLDRKTFSYRWVKDSPGRVERFKRADWDLVDEAEAKANGNNLGTIPTVHGGIGESGAPYGLVLMKKYKDWYEADQKAKRAPLDEMDKAIKRGTAHKQSGEGELTDAVTYTPGTNSVEGVTFRE